MKELDLQCLFGHWLKNNFKATGAYELKVTKTDRLNLNRIALHQTFNLNLVDNGLFYFKFPDLGLQNPFDCFTLYQEQAYVVVFFYKPRKPKKFYMISIETIKTLINGEVKSITEEYASEIAYKVGTLK